MAKKPKTLAKPEAPNDAVRMLEHEVVRQMMEIYRADHPQSTESDDALYERMRRKLAQALPKLEFDSIDNLATARALNLAHGGKMERAAPLLEELYTQQRVMKQGRIQGERSKAGNDAQALARLADLPDGHPLKLTTDTAERDRLIREHAQQLMRDHLNLKPSDIKRKVGEWAQMSAKQIGRILNPPEK